MNLNDDEDVLEMGADGLWSEGQSARLLENDRHNVVSDVSLPQQLTRQNTQTDFTRPSGRSHSKIKLKQATEPYLSGTVCLFIS